MLQQPIKDKDNNITVIFMFASCIKSIKNTFTIPTDAHYISAYQSVVQADMPP